MATFISTSKAAASMTTYTSRIFKVITLSLLSHRAKRLLANGSESNIFSVGLVGIVISGAMAIVVP